MAQGWSINATADTITFNEPPANGAAIVISEYASGAQNDTDLWAFGAWSAAFGYPSETEYFADRQIFAATITQPQTIWMSKIGNYIDFGKSSPILDDDAISATLNARQVNAIRDLVPLDKLIMLTSGGEWKTSGGQDDVLTPSTVGFQPQTYWGAGRLSSLVIGNTGIFLQARGRIVRDIGYEYEADGYRGNDLTTFSSHLFQNSGIVAWAYQQSPLSVVWVVRDDGVLLAMTYMREQEVIGWTPMETDGFVESVCCVAEADEDAVYLTIRRTIDGADKRYIERLTSRRIADVREAFFVDCGLSYDGRNTSTTTTTLTGSGWTVDDTLTLTVSAALFSAGDVGDSIVYGYLSDNPLRLEISSYSSPTVVSVIPQRNVETAYQATAITDWAWARDTMAGLDHLEGRTVAILSDGNVEAPRAVTGGAVALDRPGTRVHIGLPYSADFETLDVSSSGETVRMRKKIIKRVGLIVQDSRNIKAGASFNRLSELAPRYDEGYQAPASLQNGLVELWPSDAWNTNGRVCVRQDDPLPLTILGVIPEYEIGQ